MPDVPPVYLTNCGPSDGPILARDGWFAISVFVDRVKAIADGTALPRAVAYDPGGNLKAYRLVVHGVELEGLYLCVGQRFVRLGEAAEFL